MTPDAATIKAQAMNRGMRTLRQDGAPLFAMTDAAGADLGPTGLVAGRVAGSWAHVIELA